MNVFYQINSGLTEGMPFFLYGVSLPFIDEIAGRHAWEAVDQTTLLGSFLFDFLEVKRLVT